MCGSMGAGTEPPEKSQATNPAFTFVGPSCRFAGVRFLSAFSGIWILSLKHNIVRVELDPLWQIFLDPGMG